MNRLIKFRFFLMLALLIAVAAWGFIIARGNFKGDASAALANSRPPPVLTKPYTSNQQTSQTPRARSVAFLNSAKDSADQENKINDSFLNYLFVPETNDILNPLKLVAEKTGSGIRYYPGDSQFSLKSSEIEGQARKLQNYLVENESKRAKTLGSKSSLNLSSIVIAISPPNSGEVSFANDLLLESLKKMANDVKPYLMVEGKRLIHEYLNTNGLYRVVVVTQEYHAIAQNEPPQPRIVINQFFSPSLEGIAVGAGGLVSSPPNVNTRGKIEIVWGEIANIPQRYRHLVLLK